ncbi:hypothetical protein C8Q75DRAFT_733628 [Abortiporus biennis]|nr:hypothetical protein C8Q75DRAFT_733628 [Abortiporus biennis]
MFDDFFAPFREQIIAEVHGLRPTMGAIMLGSFICVFLSGIVTMQVFVYYRIYPKDRMAFKGLVATIWILDMVHTGMVMGANWFYLVENFGDLDSTDAIPWEVATSIALTVSLGLMTSSLYTHFISSIRSKSANFATQGLLATLRLAAAITTTGEMAHLQTYTSFVNGFSWVFTMGLAAAAIVDIAIAIALCLYLHMSRTGFSSMDDIIDTITLYTVENGMATCITTIVSLICWVAMPRNLIFLALHFAISKLYANAFMATLNARKVLRGNSKGSSDRGDGHALPVLFSDRFSRGITFNSTRPEGDAITTRVQINVEKTIHQEGEAEPSDVSIAPSNPESQIETRDDKDAGAFKPL